ncbi:hypothetical protein EHM76_04400 [bacterium]|nr:MAG: hypothetical protein EHM76_04400 [bacterium]
MIGIILICGSSVIGGQNCTVGNATAVLYAPTIYASAYACQFETMAYAAESDLVKRGDTVRIICQHPRPKEIVKDEQR